MSLDDLTVEWQRWLAQADDFARSGATDEAVARALAAHLAATSALVGASPPDQVVILQHVGRARRALDRMRDLHRTQRERTAARSKAHREAERLAAATPTRRRRRSPTPE